MSRVVFGITGGTGAGKTTVSEYFKQLGAEVIDADKVSRLITEKNTPCLKELEECFGSVILRNDKTLDRRTLGEIVFNDEKKLELLTKITHKYIKEYIEKEIENSGNELIAIDGAVIIGSPVMNLCEKLVVVTADEDIRLERIIKRDKISKKSAKERIDSQMSNSEYLSYADYIIENNDDCEKIGEEIERIYNEIKNLSSAKSEKA